MRRTSGIIGIVILAATLCIGLGSAVALTVLAPRGGERLVGLSIGVAGDTARIPRRALACSQGAAGEEICRATVAGEELRVAVRYVGARTFEFADCQATFRSVTAPCHAANYTLGAGLPRYAAASATALGLTPTLIREVRGQYPLDNLYEADWLALVPRVAVLLALGMALGLVLAPWPRWYYRPLAALAISPMSFAMIKVAFGGLLVITGLVD
jgi:hypothetical protein